MSKNFDYLVGAINFAVRETKIAPEFTKSVIQWLQKLDELTPNGIPMWRDVDVHDFAHTAYPQDKDDHGDEEYWIRVTWLYSRTIHLMINFTDHLVENHKAAMYSFAYPSPEHQTVLECKPTHDFFVTTGQLDEFNVDPRLPKFFELEGTSPSGERQEVSRTTLEWCKYWYVNEALEFEVKDETRFS